MAERCYNQTLCWDCANACGGCSWSQRFAPVEGWTAERKTVKSYNGSGVMDTYRVIDCPEFHRDALNGGLRRLPEKKRA